MDENTCGDPRNCPRGHWRPAEDEKLRQLVQQYGPQNWNSIAEKLQGRSGIHIYICLCICVPLYSNFHLISINFEDKGF